MAGRMAGHLNENKWTRDGSGAKRAAVRFVVNLELAIGHR